MLLDLSEALACPRCGPPQGLVVLVESMQGRRVSEGRLDCPRCEARYPLRDGILTLGAEASQAAPRPASATGPAAEAAPAPATAEEDAVTAAALLGVRHGRGVLVTGPGFDAASRLSALTGGCEVVALAPGAAAKRRPDDPVTPLVGARASRLPLLPRRVLGVVLVAADEAECREAARVLAPGGRLVILRPSGPWADSLADAGLEPLAADPRAIVVRRG